MNDFVELHRDEINREAYKIYKYRQQYRQEDNPVANFERAIAIVKERHNVWDAKNRL